MASMEKQTEKSKLRNSIYQCVKDCLNEKSAKVWETKTKEIWDDCKQETDINKLRVRVSGTLKTLKAENAKRKSTNFLNFFKSPNKSLNKSTDDTADNATKSVGLPTEQSPAVTQSEPVLVEDGTEEETIPTVIEAEPQIIEDDEPGPKNKPTPAQDKETSAIDNLTRKINAHKSALESGITPNAEETAKKVADLTKERDVALKRKINLQSEAKRKRLSRANKKQKVKELFEKRPEIAQELVCLTSSEKIGRPVYSKNDGLLEAIKEVALGGCGADDRRRSEIIRSVRTLDDLCDELKKMGYNDISRTALYFRLIPRRSDTREGKRHVTTVPVRLCRASNDQRSKNPDRWFAAKIMEQGEELASLFGPSLANFIGQDDKAHVPIGLTAANKQAPLLMSLKYRVKIPDHDFVIATKHKLTSTVVAAREIQENPIGHKSAVRYSGPTYIQIKSLKHTPSNAAIQIEALDSMLQNESMCRKDGLTKPILILSRDGHDGPRFPSTRDTLATVFKKHDLDFIYCVCNAAGLSAFHFIERRMAPLSLGLAGIILPHEHYGSHLDGNGNTIDPDLELKNFEKAGTV